MALLAIAGCAGPTSPATGGTPRPNPAVVGGVTPVSYADAAILSSYAMATAALVHAETTMDPNDPELMATMTGHELSTVKKNLIIDKAGGLVARGDVTPWDPHVVSVDGTTAVVRDCVYSALLLYDATSGRPAAGTANGPEEVGVTATFSFVDGAWKESTVEGKFGSCGYGY